MGKSFLNCCRFGGPIAYGGSRGSPNLEFTHLPGASGSEGGTCMAGEALRPSAGSELGLFKVHVASTCMKAVLSNFWCAKDVLRFLRLVCPVH